jgi:hypothetical protein
LRFDAGKLPIPFLPPTTNRRMMRDKSC